VFPVAIGSGFRVFPDTANKTEFAYVGTQAFPRGVVTHTYRRP
jgi:hypothetical protein